ncbi:AEC family transporter [Pokkaliibacter sp. CJK22405]|uniref:AEC family transporter n=1 Tax=Pokkaliibacter sp. CJK22405 TaxID=3384615 RepID=UPI003984F1C1
MLLPFIQAIVPVLICAGLGAWLARKTTLLNNPALPELVTRIGLPCLILHALVKMDSGIMAMSHTVAAIVLVLVISATVAAGVMKLLGIEIRWYLSLLVNPNTGNLGIPLVVALLGDKALIHAVVISTVVQISHFTLGVWVMSGAFSPKKILLNPSIIALVLGGLWIALGIPTPVAITRTLDLLSGMTLPIMLLLLGRSLATIDLRNMANLKLIGGMSLARVLLGTGVALLVAQLLGLDPLVAHTLVLQSAMPVAVITYILASQYGGPRDEVAAIIMGSTLLSMLMALVLSLVYLHPITV